MLRYETAHTINAELLNHRSPVELGHRRDPLTDLETALFNKYNRDVNSISVVLLKLETFHVSPHRQYRLDPQCDCSLS